MIDYIKICKEFKIEDLFIKKTIKGFSKKDVNLKENKNGYYVYGQNIKRQYNYKVLLDNKYLQKINKDEPILAYSSSVGAIGIISESFYRSGNNGVFQGLFPKERIYNIYELQYVLSVLKKHFDNFGYATGMANIKDLTFILPIRTDKNNKPIIDNKFKYHKEGYIPDFEYMEKYIKAIMKIYIKKLEEKIKIYEAEAGISNCDLTEEDKKNTLYKINA